ncbi:rhomboid family intramembrane serine protease [Desulfuromonas versatilis]|uniref:Rhomboid family intramembrane serine protease n=2 Tax=Desulfuromonas versatilis TaxID=2802975 RepID=A0ABM8HQP2_9BACT|nr:rhomboid family intramembrane serine protease [Desulfuromonas versatilis]
MPSDQDSRVTPEGPAPLWVPIRPPGLSAAIHLSEAAARNLALVLEARGIACRLQRSVWGWQLSVPQGLHQRADQELRLHHEENRNWPPTPTAAAKLTDNGLITASVLGLLGLFHSLTFLRASWAPGRQGWLSLGEAAAGKILDGEWWRLVTSLTLHVDGQHLFGNLLIGGVFIILLCRRFGSGQGWCLLLLSGVLGNLANALIQSPAHRAVGLSTAVFGAVGILGGESLLRNRRRLLRRWPLPLAAAGALLAMLGTGGERTDLGAHLFGFAAGTLLGLAVGRLQNHPWPHRPLGNALLAATAALVPLLAWLAAINRSP